MKRKKKAQLGVVIQPTKEDTGYVWEDLELKQSQEKGAGCGVFATRKLKVGEMIPIVGAKVDANHNGTHDWTYYGRALKGTVTGDPSINPYKGIGNYGLSIAMMLNETTTKKPNCKFTLNHVVVALPVKKGQELFVHYGDTYEPTRILMGYSDAMKKNKYLGEEQEYTLFDALKYPPPKERNGNIEKWNGVIAKGIPQYKNRVLPGRVPGQHIVDLRPGTYDRGHAKRMLSIFSGMNKPPRS